MSGTILKSGIAAAALAALLAAPAAFAQNCPALRPVELAPGQNVGALTQGFAPGPLRDHEVVLTFDDGPDPVLTPRVLDLLKANCVKATFFPLGGHAKTHPDLVKRMLAEGHSVGGHTVLHAPLPDMTLRDAGEDINAGFKPLIAAGAKAQLFRFPQLATSPALLVWTKDHGLAAVSADVDPWDWEGKPSAETLQRIKDGLKKAGNRGIILMHDVQPNTVKLLPDLIGFLRGEGYSIVRLTGPTTGKVPG